MKKEEEENTMKDLICISIKTGTILPEVFTALLFPINSRAFFCALHFDDSS